MSDRAVIEEAFRRIRSELEVPESFPAEVERAAEEAAEREGWKTDGDRVDLSELPFATIDPPGSRDLDQALLIERAGAGFRLRYAIADVACFVDRGSILEREAWQRGVTYYSPDRRDPLYPPVLSQGAGSLLPGETRPAVVFTFELDERAAIEALVVRRSVIRSRAQLTYSETLDHVEGAGRRFAGEPFAESLLLLRELGELRLERERERGGVSLPILDQHVQQETALRVGYDLVYEEPNAAEEWNAQVSLLTGHAAADRMLAGGIGLLRTTPPSREEDVARFRTAARALGFDWPADWSYPRFIHSLSPGHPRLPILVWQARHLMRGADYIPFENEPPEHPRHSALAMTYAHCTAPLRRLADRYVLDLLVDLENGRAPSPEERETLHRLPAAMDAAERRANRLERQVIEVAEAWELRDRVGDHLPALVLDVRRDRVEIQIADPPVRARVPLPDSSSAPTLGAATRVRVDSVSVAEGLVEFSLAE